MEQNKAKALAAIEKKRNAALLTAIGQMLDWGDLTNALLEVRSLIDSAAFDWCNLNHRAKVEEFRNIIIMIGAEEDALDYELQRIEQQEQELDAGGQK